MGSTLGILIESIKSIKIKSIKFIKINIKSINIKSINIKSIKAKLHRVKSSPGSWQGTPPDKSVGDIVGFTHAELFIFFVGRSPRECDDIGFIIQVDLVKHSDIKPLLGGFVVPNQGGFRTPKLSSQSWFMLYSALSSVPLAMSFNPVTMQTSS